MLKRFLVAVLSVALAAVVTAQQAPAPGPEHQLLKQDVGTWDANVEYWFAPNTPPSVSNWATTVDDVDRSVESILAAARDAGA